MRKILSHILKFLGVFMIILLLTGYGFYSYLFEREHKYYEVQNPKVKENLDK